MEIYWLLLGAAASFFVAWNNGSNNAANAIGTVVGSGALTLRKALVISAFFDFFGAMLFGQFVSKTIMAGIVDIRIIQDPSVIVKGMIAALIATGLWVLIASWLRIPMSISEGTVGGVMGFGMVAVGISNIKWGTVTVILGSWVILPGFSAVVAIALYFVYERMFKKNELLPYIGASSLFLMVFSTVFLLLVKTAKLSDLSYVLGVSLSSGLLSILGFAAYYFRLKRSGKGISDNVIKALLLVAAASMAFSHGANDVANSAGPLMAVVLAHSQGSIPAAVSIDPGIIAFAAAGIAIGIITWGQRVVETIGEDITTLTYSSAFTAQLAASLSVLILTRLGLPVSTTIAIVGAVAGVGLAKGFKAVNARVLAKIFSAWIIALPVVMGISAGLYLLFMSIP